MSSSPPPERTAAVVDLERRGLVNALAFLAAAPLAACGGNKGSIQDVAWGRSNEGSGEIPAPSTAPPAPRSTTSSPAPAPGPLPPAPPPPPPPPPIANGVTTLTSRQLDFTKIVMFKAYFEGGRYERYQRMLVLTGSSASLKFFGWDWTGGSALRALSAPSYELLVDGVARATATVAPGATEGEFSLDLTGIAEGWHQIDIRGAAAETCPQFPVYVQRGTSPVNGEAMPVCTGTWSLLFHTNGRHFIGTVPAREAQTVIHLTPRETPSFTDLVDRTSLVQTQILPVRQADVHRPSRMANGLLTTFNTQVYFWHHFIGVKPRFPLLDGPRGQGSVAMPTHLQVGRNGKVYFCDSWRVGVISPYGVVKTLAGFRHRSPPSYWENDQNVELVGDWSAIPETRRGFHEIWGMAWDARSLSTDPTAAAIGGEQPHVSGPRAFVADTQNNRVCLITFSPVSHDAPAKVTEFLTGLADPWDVVCDNGVLYVSERGAHRISAFDATTGARLRTVVEGAALSSVSPSRFPSRSVPLATVQAEKVVGPEGLVFQDGWLYYASRVMEQVKRVNVTTGAVEVVANVTMDNNSQYAKIAISDGTFGPRGTVFVVTWSVLYYGFPQAYLPDGRLWNYQGGLEEPGTPYATNGYPTAVAVGGGKLLWGGAIEGLVMLSRKLSSDVQYDHARYKRGEKEYINRGYPLLNGHAGWGFFGVPLPWGVSDDIDYFLAAQGHKR